MANTHKRNVQPERTTSITGQPAFNEEGVPHVYAKGPEAAEMAEHLHKQRGVGTDHQGHPTFNPAVSRQQAKAMFAAAEGHSTLGIPAKVGKDFTKGYVGRPGSVKALPNKARVHQSDKKS